MKNIKIKVKDNILLIVIVMFVLVAGLSYAYFTAITSGVGSTDVSVSTEALPDLEFVTDGISLVADSSNFAYGFGDVAASSSPYVTLDYAGEITQTYNVYLVINNELKYSSDDEDAELVLVVKDENGDYVTDISGLTTYEYDGIVGYDITEVTGLYTVKTDVEISTTSENNSAVQTWTYSLHFINLDVPQNDNIGAFVEVNLLFMEEEPPIGRELILLSNGGTEYIESKETPDFSQVSYENEGMYAAEDDYGTSYYFRGEVDNNWIYYAGAYWKIIRIDGNGDIRMIYSGTTAPTEDESIAITNENSYFILSEYNLYDDSFEYVGYMYELEEMHGYETDGAIKTVVDEWYEENILNTNYEDYVADAIYCNDRTAYSSYDNYINNIQVQIIGTDYINFSSVYRLGGYEFSNDATSINYGQEPSLICENQADAFTTEDVLNGNGALTYSIGLITADELSLAGNVSYAVNGEGNEYNYLYCDTTYWTMTPYGYDGDAQITVLYSDASIDYFYSNTWAAVRPVITISGDVTIIGSGTWDDYYELVY